MTGNVTEWTQSIYRSYNRQHPYVDDDDRNHDDVSGERVLRGGSWYTASIAVLYIPTERTFARKSKPLTSDSEWLRDPFPEMTDAIAKTICPRLV